MTQELQTAQKYAAYDADSNVVGFYCSIDSPVPDGVDVIAITDEQYAAASGCNVGTWKVAGGVLVAPAPPSAADLLLSAKALKIAELYGAYQCAMQQPVSFKTSAGVEQIFQADNASQNILLIATTGYGIAGSTPAGFYWVALDNTQVPFSLDDLKGLYGAMLAQGNVAFNKLQMLKADVRRAATIADVESVSW
ncbi:DUF4376 domain-containing protein [Burkholderia multivorans]|nr:DUF4376 domain-containing protein [Burkholderia multivorans]